MFQNLQLPAAQEVRESNNGMAPCIVMKNYEVLYYQVSLFSPERWKKVVLQERAVTAFTVCLESTAWCNITPSMSYATMNITFTAYYVGRVFFERGEQGCFHSFDWLFKFGSIERAQFSSKATIRPRKSSPSLWYRSNKACATA